MAALKPAAQRFADAARAAGLAIDVVEMAQSTRTAEEAARAAGCTVGQIVKSLVFKGRVSGRAYLLLVSGQNRVNEKLVAGSLGEELARPDAEFVRDVTGYAIGGIPPLGHKQPLDTYIDSDLLAFDLVWAAAGTPEAIFAVAPERLAEAAGARPIAVK